jgi:VWFA-related protein
MTFRTSATLPAVALTVGMLWPQETALQRERLVTLNVVAFDSKGLPVGDLTEDDFQIQDQGKKQQIVMFRRNESGRSETAPLRAHEYSNRAANTPQHATVILLDLLNGNMSDRGSGWEGVDRALQHMESGDNLYLYLLTADSTLYPVRGIQEGGSAPADAGHPWTQNVRAMLDQAVRAVNRLKPVDDQDPMIRVKGTYHVLGTLASQMATLPGRKNLVWITHGVPIVFASITHDLVDMNDSLRQFCAGLNRAGIAVYTVDQGGPGSLPTGREGPGYQSQDTLEQMANLTGGRPYPGNNAEAAIPAAIASSHGSYVIVYHPPAENWDGKFHKVSVHSTRKGIKIQAQTGYLAAKSAGDDRMAAVFQGAAEGPLDAPGIGVRALVTPGANGLHVDLRIDPADLMLVHEGDHDSGQMAIGFLTIGGKESQRAPILKSVNLTKEQRAAAMKDGLPFVYDRALGADVEKLRIVVLDVNSLEVGALTVPVR